mmetsp:Transcript_16212/g.44645  ORF Transcript_16212/g.44645 Transcript_16212/m.44645 type:complete len:205 (-) Transcript_16212:1018-1632(-)
MRGAYISTPPWLALLKLYAVMCLDACPQDHSTPTREKKKRNNLLAATNAHQVVLQCASRRASIKSCGILGISSRTCRSTAAKSSASPRRAACQNTATGSRASSAATAPGKAPSVSSRSWPPSAGRYNWSKARNDAKTAGAPSRKTTSQSCKVASSGHECEASERKCSDAKTSRGTSRKSNREQTLAGRMSLRRTKASNTAASLR